METNEVQKTEIVLFQHVLNKEQMSVTLKNDSLLCKLCHVYLLQRSNKNPNLSNYTSDFIEQQDIIIKRYHLKIKYLVLMNVDNNHSIPNQPITQLDHLRCQ